MTNDYYRILGVLDDTEDIVIKAAYRALAQRYHPDKWMGGKDQANRRMADINEAFSVLSDPVKREAYDSTRVKNQFDEEDIENEEELLSSVERDWIKVSEYFPDLKTIGENLAKISKSLEYAYKVTLLERKNFDDRERYAEVLKKHFLEKYFGSNIEIVGFARMLILGGKRAAAKELNEVVKLIGPSIDVKNVIDRIKDKFDLKTWFASIYSAQQILDGGSTLVGKSFFEHLGCNVQSSFLSYSIEYKGITKKLSIGAFEKFMVVVAMDFLEYFSVDIIQKHLSTIK